MNHIIANYIESANKKNFLTITKSDEIEGEILLTTTRKKDMQSHNVAILSRDSALELANAIINYYKD